MPKFRKKPVVIEAEQFLGEPVKGVCQVVDCSAVAHRSNPPPHVHAIHEGTGVYVMKGDWIIPEPDGKHFYPVKPYIFEATYELIKE